MIRCCEIKDGRVTSGTCVAFNSGARPWLRKSTVARMLAIYSDLHVMGRSTRCSQELDPLCFYIDSVDGLASRHEQPIPFHPAEAYVGAFLGEQDLADAV